MVNEIGVISLTGDSLNQSQTVGDDFVEGVIKIGFGCV